MFGALQEGKGVVPAGSPSAARNGSSSAPAAGTVRKNGPTVAFHYLSDLLDCRVRYVGERRPFGRLQDIGASAGTPYPQATVIDVKGRHGRRSIVPWANVETLSPRELVVRRDGAAPPPAADFWARRDVLDDQVVDVSGARVLRVNDLHLLHSGSTLMFAHVEVGMLGLLRRLRFERPVSFLLRWLFDYTLPESFVTWRHLEVLSPGGVPGGVRVAALNERLTRIHPGELADILERLGVQNRQQVFNALSIQTAAHTLEAVTPEFQRTLVTQEQPDRVAKILGEMPTHEAADLLRELGPDAPAILRRMEQDMASDVASVLAHDERTAGGVMSTDCIEAAPDQRVSEVLAHIRRTVADRDVYTVIYVLDAERRLLGVASLKYLLAAADDAPMEAFMMKDSATVGPDTRLRDVARVFLKYGFLSLPVVGADGVFLGAVNSHSVMPELSAFLKD